MITPTRGKLLITNAQTTTDEDKMVIAVKTKKVIPMSGVVVAVGEPITERDKKIVCNARPGDTVYFQRWSGVDAHKHIDSGFKIFLKFSDILAVKRKD